MRFVEQYGLVSMMTNKYSGSVIFCSSTNVLSGTFGSRCRRFARAYKVFVARIKGGAIAISSKYTQIISHQY